MSVVTITLNNKQFQIGCNDGEESLLKNAAEKLKFCFITIQIQLALNFASSGVASLSLNSSSGD